MVCPDGATTLYAAKACDAKDPSSTMAAKNDNTFFIID